MNYSKIILFIFSLSLFYIQGISQNLYNYGYYTVQKGDYLGKISKIHGVSVESLREWNGLEGNYLKEGQKLRVTPPSNMVQMRRDVVVNPNLYTNRSVIETPMMVQSTPNIPVARSTSFVGNSSNDWIAHKIQPGENLQILSSRYGVSVEDLIRYNNLKSSLIKAGDILLIMPFNMFQSGTPSSGVSFINAPTTSTATSRSIIPVVMESTRSVAVPSTSITTSSPITNTNSFAPMTGDMRVIQYTVTKGDNLYTISQRFRTNKNDIRILNQLPSEKIVIGQNLWIPVK